MKTEERETEETLFLRLKNEYKKEIRASKKREKFLSLTGDEYKREVEDEKREAEKRRKGIIKQIIHEAIFKETSDLFLHPIPYFRDYLPPTSPIIRAIEIIDKARTFLNLNELSENKIKLKFAIAIFLHELIFKAQFRAGGNHPYFLNIQRKTNEPVTNIYDVNENIIVSEANMAAFYKPDELKNYEIYAVLAISLAWRVLQDSTDNKFNNPDRSPGYSPSTPSRRASSPSPRPTAVRSPLPRPSSVGSMPVENMLHLQDATHLLFEAQKLYDKFLLEEKKLAKQIATNRAYITNSKKLNENKKRNDALKNEAEDIVKTNLKLKSHYYTIAKKIHGRKEKDRLGNIELKSLDLSVDQIARLLKEMFNYS